jgi:acetamidase/formamidase
VRSFHVTSDDHHFAWDNTLPAAITIAPGDEVTLDLLDASGGQVQASDGAEAVGSLDFSAINPCTGPVVVDGVGPGDELVVSIVDIDVGPWSWTANIPGFGLLADDFPDAHMWISTVRNGVITTPIGAEITARPMIGTIGLAQAAAGKTPLLVPTESGGNMDICDIGVGTTLHLPVRVPGAMLSAGDTHAVQGDGEVCGTGAETNSKLTVRVDVAPHAQPSPWFTYPGRVRTTTWSATTGVGPDVFTAARDATRRAVDLVSQRHGVAPVDAYLLLSLVGELRISEIVNAPNWVVTMHVPTAYL